MSPIQSRRRLHLAIRDSLRELNSHLALLNRQVGTRVALKDGDLACLDLIARHGPISPSALARTAGVHPATLTGVLDRLERDGWIVRERDPADRRGVVVRALPDRGAEMLRLYSGMNSALARICAGYRDEELAVVADFLQRTAAAGRRAADELADG
jgi:DNA-binding MarR family transcriptional regulator